MAKYHYFLSYIMCLSFIHLAYGAQEVNPRLIALNKLLMREDPRLAAEKSWLAWIHYKLLGEPEKINEYFILKIQERINNITKNQNPQELQYSDSPKLQIAVDQYMHYEEIALIRETLAELEKDLEHYDKIDEKAFNTYYGLEFLISKHYTCRGLFYSNECRELKSKQNKAWSKHLEMGNKIYDIRREIRRLNIRLDHLTMRNAEQKRLKAEQKRLKELEKEYNLEDEK